MRWLLQMVAALMLFVAPSAMACPLCANSLQLTISAQELIYAEHSVLAMPVADRNEFQVVTVLKGDPPPNNKITAGVFRGVTKSEKPLLLIRDDDWLQWVNFGQVSPDQADWLRKLSRTKRTIDMTEAEWREQVAYFLPYLENAEPMVAEIAFNEFASAPYGALRSLKPHLDVATIRAWLNNPKLAKRQPVYLLLLGIAGTEQDEVWLEERIEIARKTHSTNNLAALLGADFEIHGIAGVDRIEKLYLSDPTRTKPEIETALVALRVHADTDGASARHRVMQAFRLFAREHPSMASLVAPDLAASNKADPKTASR
jgi:hypothetical protein